MSEPIVTKRFVGYDGRVGFDDGWEWQEARERQGWEVLSSWGLLGWDLGSWPYLVYAIRTKGDRFSLAEYSEADETRWSFATAEEREAFIDEVAAKCWRRGPRDSMPAGLSPDGPVRPEFRGPYSQARVRACTHPELSFDPDGKARCVQEQRVLSEEEYQAACDRQAEGVTTIDPFGGESDA